METMITTHLLLLSLSLCSSFPHLATSTCHPRNSTHFFLHQSASVLAPSPTPTQPKQPSPDSRKQLLPESITASLTASSQHLEKEASPESTIQTQQMMTKQTIPSFLPPIPGIRDNALKGVCDRTTYPGICQSYIKPFLPTTGSANFDLKSILEMQLKAGKIQTDEAWAQFSKLAKDPNTKPTSAATLEDCMEKYNDTMAGYDSALAALAGKDIPTVEINLDAVLQGYESCGEGDAPEDPVADPKGPWADYNEKLRKLTDNCFDLTKLLK